MFRFSALFAAIAFGLVTYHFSAWRMKRTLDQNSTPLVDPTINALTDRLARELEIPQIPVHVYEIDMVNGLAAPDGRVFITRGFLNKVKMGEVSAAEIASVIAHELGHVALGHSKKRMIDFTGSNAVRTVLAIFFSRFIPFVGVYIANFVTQVIMARLSRDAEYEADAYAAALLTKAGIGVAPQISLFEKLDRMAPAGQPMAWLMSHPKTEERIAAIERLEAGWSA